MIAPNETRSCEDCDGSGIVVRSPIATERANQVVHSYPPGDVRTPLRSEGHQGPPIRFELCECVQARIVDLELQVREARRLIVDELQGQLGELKLLLEQGPVST